jgi:serine/threonine protein kinase
MNEPAHDPSFQPDSESTTTARADEELLAALADDFAARLRRGEHPQVEEYVDKHPALGERIRTFLVTVQMMEQTRSFDVPPAGEGPGTIIGRYKLLERIGEGGFGVVYMAEQQHPVRRKVALKVVKPGMDSRQVLARFEAERQALAIMDHPNIAKVLDAGATDSGRPYFVMELIKGEPITEFCDRNQFSPHQRLELFSQVCHAVQHAHQKGIIHRDIKPTNVLVGMHDTTPVVKVIDFGVAKALGQELTDKTLFTGFAQFLGTPLYMSPEQAGQSVLDVDTRSDIYSLGVLLYELLTGTTPFDKARFQKAAHEEICRIIREEEPPWPSTRLSESKDSLSSISAQRHTEPAKLTKLVRGELDWIVMKALEKERTRRYETAIGMAHDIERYLHDEPVEACPASTAYRAKKFVRRNRAAFVTATVVTIALVTGTVVSTWQAIRATRAEHLADARLDAESEARAAEAQQRKVAEDQRREAELQRAEAVKQRTEAEVNFQKARQAVDEYFTLVSESTLLDVPGLQSLRRDLLEAALRFYKGSASQRSSDPDVLANLAVSYIRVAEIYHATDRNDDAIAPLGQALDAIDQLRREYPKATAAHRKLAGFWKGLRLITVGTELPRDTEKAFEVLQRLASTWEILSTENPSFVEFQNDLAAIENHIGSLLAAA